jgi:phenylacetaldehyde dehydrogenase
VKKFQMAIPQALEPPESAARRFIGRAHKLLINGQWTEARSGATIAVEDPCSGAVVAHVPAGSEADVDLAVAAARRAFAIGPWPALRGPERARLLCNLADIVERNAEELSIIEATDVGQPVRFARAANIGSAPEILRYVSGWAGRLYGETVPTTAPGDWHVYTVREPCGVVGQIVPWNVPFAMAISKIGAALAAGCCVVVKPAELTPLSTLRLGEMIQEAGIPDGVVNIVTGYGAEAGAALVAHPDVDKIAFTGSTTTGKAILRASAGTLKRVTLELGGKAPVLILADADVDRAIAGTAGGIFFNSGQACTAGSRVYVDKRIADRVVAGLLEHASRLKVGNALDPTVSMGPLISNGQFERVSGYIASGQTEGAELVLGGKRIGEQGYFIEPTVFLNAKPTMRMVREEIFGPVITVLDLDATSLDSLAQQANDTVYGLNASIWTRDIGTAHKLARKIRAGSVRINSGSNVDPAVPFGGFKQSGLGRERGREGVEIYTELKSVVVGL